jgi:hypothetical protein
MSVIQRSDGITEVAVRRRWHRTRHIIIPVLVVLLAIGAAALWGPVGLGSGPLEVVMNIGDGGVDAGQTPVGFIIPMYNSGGSGAVVDSIDLVDGTRYPAPRILALGVLASARCLGPWPAKNVGHGFVMVGCGGQYHGPLTGRVVDPTTQRNSWGFPAAAEVAAPRPGTCWVISQVVVHYHVGIRYYAATDWFQLVECGRGAHLDPAMNAAAAAG